MPSSCAKQRRSVSSKMACIHRQRRLCARCCSSVALLTPWCSQKCRLAIADLLLGRLGERTNQLLSCTCYPAVMAYENRLSNEQPAGPALRALAGGLLALQDGAGCRKPASSASCAISAAVASRCLRSAAPSNCAGTLPNWTGDVQNSTCHLAAGSALPQLSFASTRHMLEAGFLQSCGHQCARSDSLQLGKQAAGELHLPPTEPLNGGRSLHC